MHPFSKRENKIDTFDYFQNLIIYLHIDVTNVHAIEAYIMYFSKCLDLRIRPSVAKDSDPTLLKILGKSVV